MIKVQEQTNRVLTSVIDGGIVLAAIHINGTTSVVVEQQQWTNIDRRDAVKILRKLADEFNALAAKVEEYSR